MVYSKLILQCSLLEILWYSVVEPRLETNLVMGEFVDFRPSLSHENMFYKWNLQEINDITFVDRIFRTSSQANKGFHVIDLILYIIFSNSRVLKFIDGNVSYKAILHNITHLICKWRDQNKKSWWYRKAHWEWKCSS